MDKSVILNALFELGFRTDDIGGNEYLFKFEDLGLIYNPDEEDDEFIRISAPCIYQVTDEESRPMILEIINEVNCRIRYTKTLLADDRVWVSLESRLFDGIDAEEFLRYAIVVVKASTDLFFRKLNGDEEPENQDTDDFENEND